MTDPKENDGARPITPKKTGDGGAKDSSGSGTPSNGGNQPGNGAPPPAVPPANQQNQGVNNPPPGVNPPGVAPGANQNIVYLTTPKKGTTDLTPFQGFNIDPSSREGLSLWREATKPPPGWKFPTVDTEHRSVYFNAVSTWAERYNLVLFKLPTSGNGQIAPIPRKLAGKDLPGYDLADHRDILDDKNVRLDDVVEVAQKYSNWIFGGPTALFELPSSGQRVAICINPAAQGNEGLVIKEKLRLRRESAILYQFLQNLIGEHFKPFRLQKDKFTLVLEEDKKVEARCGLGLWALMDRAMVPTTKIDTAALEARLRSVGLADFDDDLPDLLTEMEDLRQRIEAERKTPYDPDVYGTLIFEKVEPFSNDEFLFNVRLAKKDWSRGKLSNAEVVADLRATFVDLTKQGKWIRGVAAGEKIIALTAHVKRLEAANKKLLGGGAHGGKGGANDASRGNKKKETNKGGAGKAPSWQITKAGEFISHPEKGYRMVWCPHHKSKDGVVNGMYMRHPHNHAEWETNKQKNIAERKQRKAEKRKAGPDGDKDGSKRPSSDSSKLALAKSFQSAFCSKFIIAEDDAQILVDEIMAEHSGKGEKAQLKD